MITLNKGETQTIFFTAREKCSLANPYFYFVFQNRITQEIVKFGITNTSTDERYDKFSLVVNSKFLNSETGFWTYSIYEMVTLTQNYDYENQPTVETGYMVLNPATEFTPTSYDLQPNTFVTYNG
jgi:hypothetical protein